MHHHYEILELDRLIDMALSEDIGRGDITSQAVIPPGSQAEFVIAARTELVVCGLRIVERIFTIVDPAVIITRHFEEGTLSEAGSVLLTGHGSAHSVLVAERTALNMLQHLCGIATLTRSYVQAITGTKATVLDTRKTLPGYRELQKYAVRAGGGRNHRMRLDDGLLIKDNHIDICGSITEAVRQARAVTPVLTKIEVECETLAQVEEACKAGADMILLDNMDIATMQQAVGMVNGRIPLEASGNVSLSTIRAIAETGVDFISIGKLTHSAPACDIGLDIKISA